MANDGLRSEFPLHDDIIYLNHAGVSPWPIRTAAAIRRFADDNVQNGPIHYEQWQGIEVRLRERLREVIHAPSADDIALLKNTSEALSVVAWGLPWQSGDNIVSSDQEFPSNRIVWESLLSRGVELRQAAIGQADDPEAALFSLCDRHTRLLAISSVQFATGLRMDLERIGDFCRRRDIVFCIDGIQSIGALRLDVEAAAADVVAADGHKWMMGPEGVALFYTRPSLRDRLELRQYGWHMVEAAGDYNSRDWAIARTARRFECGSPNMLGIHGLDASLGVLLDHGLDQIERQVLANTDWLIDAIERRPRLELLSSPVRMRRSGIVTFRRRDLDSRQLYESLRAQRVYGALRGGGLRLSPHFYTPHEALERAIGLADTVEA